MTALVSDLKKDHTSIIEVMNKVKEAGIGSREGQAKLLAAKEGLLAHLMKEDQQLYPVLKRAAERDLKLRRTLDVFASDMDGISAIALAFFRKYANGGEGIEFASDFGKMVASLRQRIQREENVLYMEYEKINS